MSDNAKMRVFFLVVLSSIFVGRAFGVSAIKINKDSYCADPANIALAHASSFLATDYDHLLQISKICPALEVSDRQIQSAQRVRGLARFQAAVDRFKQSKPNADFQGVVDAGKTAGLPPDAAMNAVRSYVDQEQSNCHTNEDYKKMPPVKNQGGHGWCYAFAAAGMASFYAQKDLSPEAVAIADIAPKSSWGGGGLIQSAFEGADKVGFCPSQGFPKIVDLEAKDYDARSGFGQLRTLANRVRLSGEKDKCVGSPNPVDPLIADSLNLSMPQFSRVLQLASENNIIKDLAKGKCPAPLHLNMKLHSIRVGVPGDPTDYASYQEESDYEKVDPLVAKKSIQESLNAGNVIGVGTQVTEIIGDDVPHAMVIVGQKWDEARHECLLMIRNSWGETCKRGLQDGVTCDQNYPGNYWVPYSAVLSNMNTFTFANP